MISFSVTYFCVLLFSGSYLHVFADKDSRDCCCDEKKTANVFNIPVIKVEDLNRQYNYTNGSENVFRKINNDTDITHTAEILDRGFYTALCWSEIITIVENRNGSNSVKREFAITFETKSDIPERYLKVDDNHVEPEYKQYEIYDQATKKSQIVNFTTISKSDDTVVRESRKMFCGSGPVFTRELISWARTDRKRVEFKVSPKKQNLILNDVKPSTTPPPIQPNQSDSSQKPYESDSTQTESTPSEASIVPKTDTTRSNLKFPTPSDATIINLPEFVVNTDEFQDYLKPDNGVFSPSTQGKVPTIDLNVNGAGGNPYYTYYKPGDADNKTEAQSVFTPPPEQPFTPLSSTVTPYLERSSSISSTTSTMMEYSLTPDKTSSNSGSTATDDDNSDTSEALDENERLEWKTTDCDTTYSVDKETPTYSTKPPELTETKKKNTIAKENIGANRIGSGDDYGIFDEDEPEGTRNSTKIELHRPVEYPHYELGPQCDFPKQKIVVKVKITLNDVLESTEPNNVFSTNFPIMAIEKQIVIPIEKIQRVPRVPDYMINLEWNKFMSDIGFHFFAIHEEYIQNYTQLVSEILNASPISELEADILPDETVRRLQSISNYLKFCERVNGRQDIKPIFRFADSFGELQPETNFNEQNYGFYNYLLSPQNNLNNNYRPQTDYHFPYIKESAQPTLSQLIKFVDMQRFPNVMHTMQGYSSLRHPFNTGAWKRHKSYLNNNKFQSRIKKASGEVCANCK